MGALLEWVTGQRLVKGWTNVQFLSKVCPMFVQTLSMSMFCPIIDTFSDKCLCFVQGLSQFCPIFANLSNQFFIRQNMDKLMSNICPTFVQQRCFIQSIQHCTSVQALSNKKYVLNQFKQISPSLWPRPGWGRTRQYMNMPWSAKRCGCWSIWSPAMVTLPMM